MREPLVSVVIPVFNRAMPLKRAVESCLSQTYGNLEVIIVDDASCDGTFEQASLFRDKRVRVLRHGSNRGPAASRNTALKSAGGEFIAFLDSDDEWEKDKVSCQLGVFNAFPGGPGLVVCNGRKDDGGSFLPEDKPSGIIYDPANDGFFPLRVLFPSTSSWMLSRPVVEKTGYFDERMYNWEDGDYLVRVCSRYPAYLLNKILVRWHTLSEHANTISPKLINGKEIFLENNMPFLRRDKEYLFKFYRTMAKDAFSVDRKKSRGFLFKALMLRPFDISSAVRLMRYSLSGPESRLPRG